MKLPLPGSDALAGEMRNEPRLGEGYTATHRLYEYAGVTVGALCALSLAVRLAHLGSLSPAVGVAAVALGMAEADLLSGTVHWLFDTWGTPRTPVVGALAIRTFREHHTDEKAMLAHDFIETNGHNCALSAILSVGGLIVASPFVATSLLAAAVFIAMTSQIHKWAHMDSPPPLVRVLQRMRVILSPDHHHGHHEDEHTRNYCITTGWLDTPLRVSRVWEGLEAAIVKVTGARPRP